MTAVSTSAAPGSGAGFAPFLAGTTARVQAYAELAREGPVHRIPLLADGYGWLVTGHRAVREVLTDPRFERAPAPFRQMAERICPELAPVLYSSMLHAGGDAHARLRGLVSAAFTRPRMEALEPRIAEIADALLADLAAVPPGAVIDLIESYAHPLPMTVICDLIGLPLVDRPEFARLSAVVASGALAQESEVAGALTGLVGILRCLVALRRAEPTTDLTTALAQARDGADLLSEDELTSMLWLLVSAGHLTTTDLIANGAHALMTHPEQREMLRQDPGRWPGAVEEMLRFAGPLQNAFALRARTDVDLGGHRIHAGEIMVPSLMSANHDAAQHHCPEPFDLARMPSPHLAFGHGIHHCLGAPLARIEGRVAMRELFECFPNLELAVDPAEIAARPGDIFHGLVTLPVRLGEQG